MTFVDYNFSLWPDGSVQMDEELKAASLGVEEGDRFVIQMVNDKIVFRKVAKPAVLPKAA